MKKIIEKVLKCMLTLLFLLSGTSYNAQAKEIEDDLSFQISGLTITTDYSSKNFSLDVESTSEETSFIVRDHDGKVVEGFVFANNEMQTRAYSQKRFHNFKWFGTIQLDCDVNVNIYASGSFKQINSVASATLRIANTASTAYLETPVVDYYSPSNNWPTTKVDVNYATTICANKVSAINAGVSAALINAGYTTSDTVYYRKYATGGYQISI